MNLHEKGFQVREEKRQAHTKGEAEAKKKTNRDRFGQIEDKGKVKR